jgi:hypothetical protein
MKVFCDQNQNIFTDKDYYEGDSNLEEFILDIETENLSVDYDDFVATVPADMILKDLDEHLAEFQMFTNIDAPQEYTLGKIIAEMQDKELLKKVLGLNLYDLNNNKIKAGAKVIKNVSGYDMKKLFMGSFNAFAVIVSAFLKLEKRFEKQLEIDFKMKFNMNELYKLRNFLQSFLDDRIDFKIDFNGALDDLQIKITSSNSESILAYRQRAIADFLTTNLKLNNFNSHLSVFKPKYKNQKRIELDFNFSDLTKLIDLSKQAFTIDILKNQIIFADFKDLNALLDYCYAVRIFPVTGFSRKLAQAIPTSISELEIIEKLKALYDNDLKLNPGVL